MKKNSGYVLFETLIVSTVILGTLVFLYIQLSATKESYENSFKYNTIPNLYKTKTLANYLEQTGYANLVIALDNNLDQGFLDISNNCSIYAGTICQEIIDRINTKTIIFTDSNLDYELNGQTIRNKIINNANYSNSSFNSFKKFVKKININKVHKYALIIEYNDGTYAMVTLGEDV